MDKNTIELAKMLTSNDDFKRFKRILLYSVMTKKNIK